MGALESSLLIFSGFYSCWCLLVRLKLAARELKESHHHLTTDGQACAATRAPSAILKSYVEAVLDQIDWCWLD